MKEQEFITAYKQVFNEITIPVIREEVERQVEKRFNEERDFRWKQFCDAKFNSVISSLQRAIASLTFVKEEFGDNRK